MGTNETQQELIDLYLKGEANEEQVRELLELCQKDSKILKELSTQRQTEDLSQQLNPELRHGLAKERVKRGLISKLIKLVAAIILMALAMYLFDQKNK